ncbi:hypothetical protein [Sedimentibacter sp.]|uniref:hypothetical protein n=2 Tax=Sedimentibacter sp. TaxID=1960295 RepID=UPI0028AF9BF7|nr:hypothetical protein [Sedimentibacter sp.]
MFFNRKGMLPILMIIIFSIFILLISIKIWGNKKEEKIMKEYEPINSVASVSSEKVRQITIDMNYFNIIDLLGQTKSVGSGFFILEYEVDNEYTLLLTFTKSLSQPAGFTGSDLLTQLLPKTK